MFWSGKKIFGTVKFRIAVWYAVLFAISAGICLLLAYGIISRGLLVSVDRQLAVDSRELIKEYLTGKRFRQFDREVPISAITPAETAAFSLRFPGMTPIMAFERDVGSDVFRTVYAVADDKLYELRLESDGSLYFKQLTPANHFSLVRNAFINRARGEGSNNVSFLLLGVDGQVLAASPEAVRLASEDGYSTRSAGDRGDFRVLRQKLYDGSVLEVGRTLRESQQQLFQYTLAQQVAFLVVLCIGVVCSWLIARRFISGVVRVSDAARRIAAVGDFSRRVSVGRDGSEIVELVNTFNLMNANTEKLFGELKMVTDNVAHDLRTPLTRMRGLAEVTVAGPPELSRYQDLAGVVAEECTQMVLMINTMLEITRTESCLDEVQREDVDLCRMLSQVYDLFEPLAEDGGVVFNRYLPANPVVVSGDPVQLRRMVANLLDNALKFTPEGGRVSLTLDEEESGNFYRLQIQDSGCGIPLKDQAHIFERFYRSDTSRTRPGNGLGLALVRAIVISHGGSISVNSKPGRGSIFVVLLPKKRPVAAAPPDA